MKHGLVFQELLDTFGRWGFWFSPYIIYSESEITGAVDEVDKSSFEFRELHPEDASIIAALENRLPESAFAKRFKIGNVAVGAFHGGRLVAYTWADLAEFPGLGDAPVFRRLEDHEAYLFGAFTLREYRGQEILPKLRNYLYHVLRDAGRKDFYSVTVYFNRSARRFKSKIGARKIELRFSINMLGRIHKDFLIHRRFNESRSSR